MHAHLRAPLFCCLPEDFCVSTSAFLCLSASRFLFVPFSLALFLYFSGLLSIFVGFAHFIVVAISRLALSHQTVSSVRAKTACA